MAHRHEGQERKEFRLLNVVSDQEYSKLRTKDKTDQDLAIGHSRLQGNFSGVQKEGG